MNDGELIPHLFRTEYRKIVAVLSKHFGFGQMEMAEDIASDTFLTASQAWGIEGAPKNPTAWLYHVAKNKAVNHMRREGHFKNKIVPELREKGPAFREEGPALWEEEIDLSPQNINDSQLRMMFAICHPSIPVEAQIGLSLRILCGFGIEEIANAFLTNKETINKRLFRAREKLREGKIGIELPGPADIDERLGSVLRTIYLLFNEGYYSVSQDKTMRKDLCLEAMRLCQLLVENSLTNQPQVNALLALMCLHASRFEARQDENGELILYQEQDEGLWNADLISRGGYYLHCATSGARLSKYHLEAGIAYWHTQKEDSREKWERILQLYNHLLQMEYSPIAALNRTYALSKTNGKQVAIAEAEKLNLTGNHFYYALLGELYSGIDDVEAKRNFQMALTLARTIPDQRAIQKRMEGLI
jgi:RNA polymerase sigma factor (sigma-70 family)